MAFRYINPGYGALTGNSSVETFENATYNPSNGVAIGNSTGSNKTIIILPSGDFITELYCLFDLYVNYSAYNADNFYFGILPNEYLSSYDRCAGVKLYNGYIRTNYYTSSGYTRYADVEQLQSYSLNKIWFAVHIDTNGGVIEAIVNNGLKFTAEYNEPSSYGVNSPPIVINLSKGSRHFISNIIVSDEYISPKERLIALPISQTITDMTAGASGIYIADAADQQLLQSVDVAQLIQDYGADSDITGIGLVGNPAYKTAEGLAKLTALSKSGDVITEHGSYQLSEDTLSTISDSWGLSGVTIADLQNMQFGWKVGA